MFYDNSLVTAYKVKGTIMSNDEDIYIGRGTVNNRIGIAGTGFDNMQVFNKALTPEELSILSLANKDAIAD